MTARKQTKPSSSLAQLFAWVNNFYARSEHFDDTTPARVWDLLLRARGLVAVLRGETASPGFRKVSTPNLRRIVRELKQWECNAQPEKKASGGVG